MKKRFDLIIFDWDGTLANSVDWIVHCVQTAAIECDYSPPHEEAIKDIIGLSLKKALTILFPDMSSETTEQFIASYGREFFSKTVTRQDLFSGVYDMLWQLKQNGYHLAVATGKTRKGFQRALEGTQTQDLFAITRCADETASKPHPAMLKEIIDFTGISLDRTLMVGDSIHDLKMAQNAQISAIAVTCGAHSKSLLQQYQPLCCLQQTTELIDFIGD